MFKKQIIKKLLQEKLEGLEIPKRDKILALRARLDSAKALAIGHKPYSPPHKTYLEVYDKLFDAEKEAGLVEIAKNYCKKEVPALARAVNTGFKGGTF